MSSRGGDPLGNPASGSAQSTGDRRGQNSPETYLTGLGDVGVPDPGQAFHFGRLQHRRKRSQGAQRPSASPIQALQSLLRPPSSASFTAHSGLNQAAAPDPAAVSAHRAQRWSRWGAAVPAGPLHTPGLMADGAGRWASAPCPSWCPGCEGAATEAWGRSSAPPDPAVNQEPLDSLTLRG